MSAVAQQDVQGNILCGYGRLYRHGLFLFMRVEDPDAARSWLRERLAEITTALPWVEPPPATLNVACTCEGLRQLGVPQSVLKRFPDDFHEGMEKRAKALGDTGASDPGKWQKGLVGLHLLVTVNAIDVGGFDRRFPRRNDATLTVAGKLGLGFPAPLIHGNGTRGSGLEMGFRPPEVGQDDPEGHYGEKPET